ncbi:dicarboxylate/amino acid:cation symporter [Puniceicoccales bacterium CK1056]|uniref:Dicarboxylate/amino acid:cation symporter n=1 Tax=Oceanipulchritudo coccoides TaxID=2706888 RepID=A0A6B2M1D1_9BACT|nr:dicarboxylate/amino acid:cation symporter [Oceanipulchritudo coccoides]NDV62811.1 dicarboxylate/amino acid:cation symporter [Oceanipulchritudo coccoides]
MSSSTNSKHSLTIQILAGMGIGVVVGLLCSLIVNRTGGFVGDFTSDYLVEGLFNLLGQAFLALLRVLVVPLVFVSLVCGTAALDDVRKLGRIGVRTVGLYLMTTAIAITLALIAAIIVGPGKGFGLATDVSFEAATPPSLVDVLIGIFPKNVIAAMSQGNMLQIIVFAVLFGLALTLSGKPGKRLLAIFEDMNEVIMTLVWIVMKLAPYGVFALIARTFATQGFDAFGPLIKYFVLVLGVLFLHALVTYPLLLKGFSGLNPGPFLKKLREVQIFAFSTASSNATIPITLKTVEEKLGVKNSVASFTVPLGATINMDGTAIMQGVATVFIAQAYSMGLGVTDYLMVIMTATLASIGTAGVPGVGLIMLSMVLTQVGLPVEGIGLIIGIDRLLDMVRTAVNVTGDSTVSCIVAKGEGELDERVYNDKESVQET